MAVNKQNLKRLTTEQAREIGRLGGLASAESRAKRKVLKECLEVLLAEEYEIDVGMCDYRTMDGATAICYQMVQKALSGDVRAFVEIRNTIGEMPVQSIQVSSGVSQDVIDEVEKMVSAEDI